METPYLKESNKHCPFRNGLCLTYKCAIWDTEGEICAINRFCVGICEMICNDHLHVNVDNLSQYEL